MSDNMDRLNDIRNSLAGWIRLRHPDFVGAELEIVTTDWGYPALGKALAAARTDDEGTPVVGDVWASLTQTLTIPPDATATAGEVSFEPTQSDLDVRAILRMRIEDAYPEWVAVELRIDIDGRDAMEVMILRR